MRKVLTPRGAIALALALVAAAIAAAFDMPKALGAHPWWSTKVIVFGAPIGVTLAVLLRSVSRGKAIAIFVIATVVAFGVARYGATNFAASFGEDQFAGSLWFWGWIATCGGATATLAATFRP